MIKNSLNSSCNEEIFIGYSFCESTKVGLFTLRNFIVHSAENIASTCLKIVKFITNYIPFINKIEFNKKLDELAEKIHFNPNGFSPISEQPNPIEQPKPHSFLASAKYILPPVLGVALALFILYRRTESLTPIFSQTEKILKAIGDAPPLKKIPFLPVQGEALMLSPHQMISCPLAEKITGQLNPSSSLEKITKCISAIGDTSFLDEAKAIFNCTNPSINWDSQDVLRPIKSTFRNYAKLFHPDKKGNLNVFLTFNTAYELLKQAFSVQREQRESFVAECMTRVTNSGLGRGFFGRYYIYKCLGIPFKLSGWNVNIRVDCQVLEDTLLKAIKLFSIKQEDIIRQIPLCSGRTWVFR